MLFLLINLLQISYISTQAASNVTVGNTISFSPQVYGVNSIDMDLDGKFIMTYATGSSPGLMSRY